MIYYVSSPGQKNVFDTLRMSRNLNDALPVSKSRCNAKITTRLPTCCTMHPRSTRAYYMDPWQSLQCPRQRTRIIQQRRWRMQNRHCSIYFHKSLTTLLSRGTRLILHDTLNYSRSLDVRQKDWTSIHDLFATLSRDDALRKSVVETVSTKQEDRR